MFDLLEENLSTQERQAHEDTNEESARTLNPGFAALFSMPEKFVSKKDSENKKSHLLVYVLSVFGIILALSSIGLAFAVQHKDLRAAQEKARQESLRVAALQAQQGKHDAQSGAGEENIPFQINENSEPALTSESSTSSLSLASSTGSSLSFISSTLEVSSSSPPRIDEGVITFGQDSDKDTLSDVEERVYKTDAKKPDSDLDGMLDGAEVKNLSDPLKGEHALLKNSGLVDTFTNQTYQYVFLYPKSDEWAVGAVDSSNKEVLASAATGEYISVRVEENPQKLSIFDWYTKIYAAGKSSEHMQDVSFGAWNALMREDGRVWYLVRKDERNGTLTPYVYILTYAPNAKKELNYSATFRMCVQSFAPLEIVVTVQQ